MFCSVSFLLSCQMFAPSKSLRNQVRMRINGDPHIFMLFCFAICFMAFKIKDPTFLWPGPSIPFSLFYFKMVWVPDVTYEIPVLVKETKNTVNDSLIVTAQL